MSKIDLFEIRTDILCDVYKATGNFKIRKTIADVLSRENLDKSTLDLYNDFLRRHPEFKIELPDEEEFINKGFVTGARCMKMVHELWSRPDLDDLIEIHSDNSRSYGRENHYYFFGETENPGEFFQVPQQGVILNQKVEIDRTRHPVLYRFLFAFVFYVTSDPISFLSYHFEETFKRSLTDYKDFLFIVEKENPNLIEPGKRIWNKWIEDVPPLVKMTQEASEFKALFKDDRLYNYVIGELSREDPEKWFDSQGNFIRVGRGNDSPGAVCDLLSLLKQFDYFKSSIDFSNPQIAHYAKSCFGVIVGSRSSRINHPGNPFNELKKRLVKAGRV
ncbi:MAG: hypothetical protein KIT62_07700 [Cyclobacteriaceae bacterium]|nr:hypothetical protein [Cyclobacteriaceae bacterium]